MSYSYNLRMSVCLTILFLLILACLPPTVMLPPDRLGALINQAIEHQKKKCIYHNTQLDKELESISILSDHTCTR